VADHVRRLYFPLRSSVELFADPTSVEAGIRAKEGAVLFDEVFFEAGMVIATVGEDGNFVMYRPAHELDPEDLADTRNLSVPGQGFSIAVGPETTPGVAASKMQPILQTKVVKSYAAEWHTSAIDELAALEVDWARFGSLSDHEMQKLAKPISQATQLFKDQSGDSILLPFEADFVVQALAQDAVVAARIGAAINVTSLFAPLVEQRHDEGQATGSTALGILIPDLGQLTWEAITEYRAHPASGEAREKLREFEQRALDAEPAEAQEFLRRVASSITADLMAALAETQVDVWKAVSGEALKTGVSFVPVIGPLVGPAAGIAEALGERAEQRAAWYFALMKLRQR
jgi:hypothetical protein